MRTNSRNSLFKNVWTLLVLCWMALASPALLACETPGDKADPAKTKAFARKFGPIQKTILNPKARFSASGMTATLLELEPLAIELGECSKELGQLYTMVSLIKQKIEDTYEGPAYWDRALNIDASNPFLKDVEKFNMTYGWTQIMTYDGPTERPVRYLQLSVELLPKMREFDEGQRLGVREELGAWLHRAGRYQEAFDHNKTLLADAQSKLDPRSPDLTGILTNLAQNSYLLGKRAESKSYLEQCLSIAREHKKHAVEFDMLFQLGVLAHEGGDNNVAEGFFQERLALATRLNDSRMKMDAQDTIREHKSRVDRSK